jgi:hypothetical protein
MSGQSVSGFDRLNLLRESRNRFATKNQPHNFRSLVWTTFCSAEINAYGNQEQLPLGALAKIFAEQCPAADEYEL